MWKLLTRWQKILSTPFYEQQEGEANGEEIRVGIFFGIRKGDITIFWWIGATHLIVLLFSVNQKIGWLAGGHRNFISLKYFGIFSTNAFWADFF